MNQIELESYHSHLNENHLYNSTLGASFNPAFLLMQPGSFETKKLNRLIFLHEFAHAILSTTYYGKVVFCCKMIQLEYFQYLSISKNYVQGEKKLLQIKTVLNQLINGWILSQEGSAIHTEYYQLMHNKQLKDERLLRELNQFLKKKSNYSTGFDLYSGLIAQFPNLGKRLFRELSNIDFIKLWRSKNTDLLEVIEHNNPDTILQTSIKSITQYRRGKIFIVDQSQSVLYSWAQKYLTQVITDLNFIEIKNYKKSILYITTFFLERLNLGKEFEVFFEQKVDDFEDRNKEDYETLYDSNFRQLYLLGNLGVREIEFIGEHPSDFLQQELQRLYQLNLSLNDFFATKKIGDMSDAGTNQGLKTFTPLSTIFKHVFPLQKFNIKMQEIKVVCSTEEAEVLTQLFAQLEHKNLVVIDKGNEQFSHWLETVTLIITVTSASVQLIDILRKWITSKKEEDKRIVIIIKDKNYQLPEDFAKIEEEIKQIGTEESTEQED